MVGETTAQRFPQNPDELEDLFRTNRLNAKQKAADTLNMINELKIDYAAYQAQESVWDAALCNLQHMGEKTGPKKKQVD